MGFEQFEQEVKSLAKAHNCSFFVPDAQYLKTLWEFRYTPYDVVKNHCTIHVYRKRLTTLTKGLA